MDIGLIITQIDNIIRDYILIGTLLYIFLPIIRKYLAGIITLFIIWISGIGGNK